MHSSPPRRAGRNACPRGVRCLTHHRPNCSTGWPRHKVLILRLPAGWVLYCRVKGDCTSFLPTRQAVEIHLRTVCATTGWSTSRGWIEVAECHDCKVSMRTNVLCLVCWLETVEWEWVLSTNKHFNSPLRCNCWWHAPSSLHFPLLLPRCERTVNWGGDCVKAGRVEMRRRVAELFQIKARNCISWMWVFTSL